MSLKRKLADDADFYTAPTKQLKLFPFPNSADSDVCMEDAPYDGPYHIRFPSHVSDASSASPANSPALNDTFLALNNCGIDAQEFPLQQSPQQSPVGLLQPSGAFTHHGTGCTQIPKLKVACASGLNGTRTMWSFCEQCGAISMVDDGSCS
ncbi:hypothetical protein MKEN_00670700 [Mycena kentingensis (nom. inval.)]|nr:hypothetical protein MKEN_00670700 [Mycena kentingensis (nom. inval.)]